MLIPQLANIYSGISSIAYVVLIMATASYNFVYKGAILYMIVKCDNRGPSIKIKR